MDFTLISAKKAIMFQKEVDEPYQEKWQWVLTTWSSVPSKSSPIHIQDLTLHTSCELCEGSIGFRCSSNNGDHSKKRPRRSRFTALLSFVDRFRVLNCNKSLKTIIHWSIQVISSTSIENENIKKRYRTRIDRISANGQNHPILSEMRYMKKNFDCFVIWGPKSLSDISNYPI